MNPIWTRRMLLWWSHQCVGYVVEVRFERTLPIGPRKASTASEAWRRRLFPKLT